MLFIAHPATRPSSNEDVTHTNVFLETETCMSKEWTVQSYSRELKRVVDAHQVVYDGKSIIIDHILSRGASMSAEDDTAKT